MPRKTSQNSISLFPFLAVLVCTMGALILLLLVTTRQIKKDREVVGSGVESELDPLTAEISLGLPAESQALPDFEEVESFVITPEFQDPYLVDEAAVREQQAADVERLNAQLEAETERLQQLQDELDSVNDQFAEAERDAKASEQEVLGLQTEKKRLESELSRQQQDLAALQQKLDDESTRTEQAEAILSKRESALVSLRKIVSDAEGADGIDGTVLEFTNSTGTQRSPIVIDVRGRSFLFAGTDVSLAESDFEGFPANDNPLLAGISALHRYRFPGAVASQPYVLLLVRPSGTMLFYSAQRSLSEVSIHFGYELLDEDRKVAVTDLSPEESDVLRQAIAEAMQRRRTLYASGGIGSRDAVPKHQMRVTPDGRVVMAEEVPEQNTGRFYAGDQPLPQSLRRAMPAEEVESSEVTQRDASGAQADELDQRTARRQSEKPTFDEKLWSERVERQQAESASAASAKTDATTGSDAEPQFPELYPNPNDVEDSSAQDFDEFANAMAEMRQLEKDRVAAISPEEIFGRPAAISGNLGVQSGRHSDAPPTHDARSGLVPEFLNGDHCGESFETRPSPSETLIDVPAPATDSRSHDAEDDQKQEHSQRSQQPPQVPGIPVPLEDNSDDPRAGEPKSQQLIEPTPSESDRTDSLERFDWPGQATADAAQDTRPVESPENLSYRPPANISPSAGSGAGASGGNPGSANEAAADPVLRMLMEDGPRRPTADQRRPNYALQDLLRSARESDPQVIGHHVVGIRIDTDRIAVGSQDPVAIEGMSRDQILRVTLQALANEVSKLPDSADREIIPTIDYAVGRGAIALQQRLEDSLARMDVPTRTVINVASNFAPRSQNDAEASPAEMSNPAEPLDDGLEGGRPVRTSDVPESRSQDRRLAL